MTSEQRYRLSPSLLGPGSVSPISMGLRSVQEEPDEVFDDYDDEVFENTASSGGVCSSETSCSASSPGTVSRGTAGSLQRIFGGSQRKIATRKSMSCVGAEQDEIADVAMETVSKDCIGENDLKLMTVQARFPNDDLRLFEGHSLSRDFPSLDRLSIDGISNGESPTYGQKPLKAHGINSSPKNKHLLQRPLAADGMIVLSPLLQNKFKKMAQRRQSAPSVVIRSVLNRSMRLTSHSHNNGNREDSDDGQHVDCLPFGFRLNSHEPSINLAERQYVREGRVQLSSGMQTQERYFFLFTDMLIVSKSKSTSNYKLKNRVRLDEVWMSAERMDEVYESTTAATDCSFVIGWPTVNYVATFSSPEIMELWWSDLTRLVEQSQDANENQCLNINVTYRNSNNTTSSKVFSAHSRQTTKDTVEQALQAYSCEESADCYQMWVTTGKDTTAYPLMGHERPHAIKMSCIREAYSIKSPGYDDISNDLMYLAVPGEQLSPKHECQFYLQNRSRSLKLNHDQGQKRLARLKSKTPGTFFNWARKRSLSRNSSGRRGERSANPRTYSDSWESCDEQLSNHNASYLIPSPTPSGASDCGSPKLFSRPLSQLCEDGALPRPVMTLLEIVYRKGPNTNGVFRKSANAKTIRMVKHALNQELEYDLTSVHVHVVAALLKDFLRNIPNSLLGSDHFRTWEGALEQPSDEEKIESIRRQVESLDDLTQTLLRHVVSVLHRIAENSDQNGMTSFNLAVCIAPSVLWMDPATDLTLQASGSKMVQELLRFMIDNCRSIFGEEILNLIEDEGDQENEEEVDNVSCKQDEQETYVDEHLDGDVDDTTEDDKDAREDSNFEESVGQFDRGRVMRKQLQRKRSSRKVPTSSLKVTSSMDSLDQDILEAELVLDRAKSELQQSLANHETKKKTRSTSSDDQTSQRRHSADVCSLSNDSGFTTLSNDDDEQQFRRRGIRSEDAGVDESIAGKIELEESAFERLLASKVDAIDLAARSHVTEPAKTDCGRRRSEPVIRGKMAVAYNAGSTSKHNHKDINHSENNNNNNNNNSNNNNQLAEKYLQTIRQSSVDHIFSNSLNGLVLPETLFEVSDDQPCGNGGESSIQRPLTLSLFTNRRRSSLNAVSSKEMRDFHRGIAKQGGRHQSRRSSYTHGCHLERFAQHRSSDKTTQRTIASDIFYTEGRQGQKSVDRKQEKSSGSEASESPKTPVKSLTPVSPIIKPKSAFVPCEYTATFCGGVARSLTPTRCHCDGEKSSSGVSSDSSTPIRHRRSRPKVNALTDALKRSTADGTSLFSLSLPSKTSITHTTTSNKAETPGPQNEPKRSQLKNVDSLDRRLRSSTSVPGLATSPCRTGKVANSNFDRAMSGSVRARINAFNRGDVSNASRKISETAIRDALLYQHQQARKTSMPASFVNLDTMLKDFECDSSQRRSSRRRRKENLVTRDDGVYAKPIAVTPNERRSDNHSDIENGQRRLSDEALLTLSESLAFGNRKTPRSSFSKQNSVGKPSEPEVEGSSPTRRRSRRKRSARLSHANNNTNNNNNNNNLKHSMSYDDAVTCSPIVFQLKELENAAESYV
uniref:Protein FAM13A n=1 Tax=Phallusia mammillata TaxID=59560 RepID=A0A6F9DBS9_9ASCI|nr:protein FAM13A [Phallusia mammillata]